jgi:cystathionine beta-lyase family protein involved in aluminum resistance
LNDRAVRPAMMISKTHAMAAAMIDRLIHHGHLLVFEGPSYRMEHALMRKTASERSKGGDEHGR